MLSYLFLALFGAAAVLNLIAAAKKNKKLFIATKPLLLSLLCLYCLAAGAPSPDFPLIAALGACFLGDVLLLKKGDLWFFAGGVSFLCGHALLIFVFARLLDFARLPLPVLIPAALLYALFAGCVTVLTRKNTPAPLLAATVLYLACNAATNLCALARLTESPGVWTAASFCGALLFFTSDCALILMRGRPAPARFYKTDFFVMLTYIAGVLLITLGLVPVGG